MVLRNHGLLAVGRTVPETFLRLYRLERTCQVQVDAAADGTLNLMPETLATQSDADLDSFHASNPDGEGVVEFDALMRKLDRIDRIDGSYRH